MSRRRKIILVVLLGGVVGLLWLVWGMREPRYQGRTLTSWLERWESLGMEESNSAILAIGAEKALPHLLSMIKTRDEELRSWMVAQNEIWNHQHFRFKSAEDIQALGVRGFFVLGTNAAAAIPELTNMLDDTNHAYIAVQALLCIGEPARKSLFQALTNSDWQVRRDGARYLAGTINDPEVYFTQLKECLNDANGAVRLAAIWGTGAQTNNPDLAIPILIAALKDPDDDVSSKAALRLAGFGTNSLRAFPVLSDLLQSGKPKTESAALRTLASIAPREMLPMVLERFRSADIGRRRQALQLLCWYPLKTPEVQAAIEEAAVDADSEVSLKAKEFIREQQREGQRRTH